MLMNYPSYIFYIDDNADDNDIMYKEIQILTRHDYWYFYFVLIRFGDMREKYSFMIHPFFFRFIALYGGVV